MKDRVARVAVNGYGVIGKRVADAVTLQEDMELVGIADVVTDYRIRLAVERGYPVYAATDEARAEMEAERVPVAGTLAELLDRVDIVVDCTPKKVGARNRPLYEQRGVKSIWQGGEKHEVAGYSFVAQVNYAGALDRGRHGDVRRPAGRLRQHGDRAACQRLHHALRAPEPVRSGDAVGAEGDAEGDHRLRRADRSGDRPAPPLRAAQERSAR